MRVLESSSTRTALAGQYQPEKGPQDFSKAKMTGLGTRTHTASITAPRDTLRNTASPANVLRWPNSSKHLNLRSHKVKQFPTAQIAPLDFSYDSDASAFISVATLYSVAE
jgi:hypothetical protein